MKRNIVLFFFVLFFLISCQSTDRHGKKDVIPKELAEKLLDNTLTLQELQELLERDIDLETPISYGATMLMVASANNEPELCKALISAGANLTVPEGQWRGYSALDEALRTNVTKNINPDMMDTVKILLDAGADPCMVSFVPPSVKLIELLQDRCDNPDLNLPNRALVSGVYIGSSEEVILSILNLDVDINKPAWVIIPGPVGSGYNMPETALNVAVERENKDLVELLLEKGADPNIADDSGRTAITYIADHKNAQILDILVDAGADVNALTSASDTALLYVVAERNPKPSLVSGLLDAGADVNIQSKSGQTPLIIAAARTGNPDIFSMLLNAGADQFAVNNDGKTAYDYALANSALNRSDAFLTMRLYKAMMAERLSDDALLFKPDTVMTVNEGYEDKVYLIGIAEDGKPAAIYIGSKTHQHSFDEARKEKIDTSIYFEGVRMETVEELKAGISPTWYQTVDFTWADNPAPPGLLYDDQPEMKVALLFHDNSTGRAIHFVVAPYRSDR